jgi:hypothetical protein
MPACLNAVELLESHMPPMDSLNDADITIRLHLHKIQVLVLNELLKFMGKFSEPGSAANIQAMERLKEHKKIIQDVIDLIESSEKPVTVN